LDDERLKWLEVDFIQYLDKWKASTVVRITLKRKKGDPQGLPKQTPYLTRDTDDAVRLTTQSMVMCIK